MADAARQRDVMFCHQCENEWYRDEHGLTCPECHSDFCEVIEANNDPRLEEPGQETADDPEEGDIDSLRWTANQPGAQTFHRTFTYDSNSNAQEQGQGTAGGGIAGFLGSVIGGLLGAGQQQPQQHQAQGEQQQQSSEQTGSDPQQQGTPAGGTRVRHFQGPGFQMTFATSTNLHPRDPHGPQPFQQHPQHIEAMMNQMFMNIGAGRAGGGPPMMFGGTPHMHGGDPMFGPGAGSPFGNLFQLLGMGPGGVHGDYVLDQAGLDQVISDLMARHASGNAPGPASEEAIRNLPSRKITEKDLGDNGKAECSICMDEVELGTSVTELPCHHWFHFDCVKHWLTEHDTCPHCRQGIMPQDHATNSANQPRQPHEAPLHNIHTQQYGQMPGSFPFAAQPNPTSSNAASPSAGPNDRRGSNSRRGSAGNMFRRMRDAFGSGSQHDHNPGSGGGPSSGGGGSGIA